LVRLSFKEVRSYFRSLRGCETCRCGRSGLGSDWKHNSLSFKEVLYILGACISTKQYWLHQIIYKFSGFVSAFISQEYSQKPRVTNSLRLHPPILYLTLVPHHRKLPITHLLYTPTPITTHYNTYNDPSNSQCTQNTTLPW